MVDIIILLFISFLKIKLTSVISKGSPLYICTSITPDIRSMVSKYSFAFTFTVSASISDPSVQYGAPAYCATDVDPSGMALGVNGGSFSSTSGLSISTNGTIDLSASTPGMYTVNLSTANCPNVTGTTVEVKGTPMPSITGTLSYCESDGSTSLSADQSYDSYSWSSGGAGQTESVSAANNPISLTVSSNGCSGTSAPVNVTAIANPAPSITGTL